MRIENAFASQVELPHPGKRLPHAGIGRGQEADAWIGKKILKPFDGFSHGERRGESAFVGDDVEELAGYQGREDEFPILPRLGVNRRESFCVGRMVSKGQLNKDVAIQANH